MHILRVQMPLSSKKIFEFVILAVMGTALYIGVTLYRDSNYEKAVQSPNQIHHCGKFLERTKVVHERFGGSDQVEYLYTFADELGVSYSFTGSRQVIKHLPRLTSLQPKQPICFQYTPTAQDRNGLFATLTKIE